MMLGVVERNSNISATEEEASKLAIAFFRSCLYDIALCERDLDIEILKQWEGILRGGDVRDYSITRYYRAISETKSKLRNPTNVTAYLVYRMSHGGHPDISEPDLDGRDEGIRRCIACSAPIDEDRRARMIEKIDSGFRIKDVKAPIDLEEIVNTHLTQEEMCKFVGHEVSFSYQERKIQEMYEKLEMERTDR